MQCRMQKSIDIEMGYVMDVHVINTNHVNILALALETDDHHFNAVINVMSVPISVGV